MSGVEFDQVYLSFLIKVIETLVLFMAPCSNTCISKCDTMLGTKRIELKQVQLPCQAKIHFLCHTLIMDIFSKTAYLIHFFDF